MDSVVDDNREKKLLQHHLPVVQQSISCRKVEETISQPLNSFLDGDPTREKLAHEGFGVIGQVLACLLFVFHVQP